MRPLLMLLVMASSIALLGCQKLGDLTFEPYVFETTDGQKINAELGRLTVPENRNNPHHRLIELAFVRLKSTAKNPGPPVIFLAGGPGFPGIELAQGPRSPALLAMREIGDVIALDQRGTGLSEPSLSCDERLNYPLATPATREDLQRAFEHQARECAKQWKQRDVDLAAYNTNDNADDVDALRQALRVDKISLLAGSYGTTLALTIIRRHAEHIQSAIMVGVEGPSQTIKLPRNGQQQLLKLADLYKSDLLVSQRIPDLMGMMTVVDERLKNQGVTVEVDDPEAKRKVRVTVGEFDFKLMAAGSIGFDDGIREFPASLQAMSQGDYAALGLWALGYRRQEISAMQAAMDCASGVSPERWSRVKDEEQNTLLGRGFDFPFPDVCEAWGVRQLEPAFRSEIKSEVRTLFISGTLDGRTPASNAEEIQKGFPNSTMVTIGGAAHGNRLYVGSPQITQVMLEFMNGIPLSVTRIALPPIAFAPLKGH
jgi:pimeloyl-ACP methyl ester carboxylesterase